MSKPRFVQEEGREIVTVPEALGSSLKLATLRMGGPRKLCICVPVESPSTGNVAYLTPEQAQELGARILAWAETGSLRIEGDPLDGPPSAR